MTGLVLRWGQWGNITHFGRQLRSSKPTGNNRQSQPRFHDRPQTGFVQINASSVCLTLLTRLG
jgi:hypothetical protein